MCVLVVVFLVLMVSLRRATMVRSMLRGRLRITLLLVVLVLVGLMLVEVVSSLLVLLVLLVHILCMALLAVLSLEITMVCLKVTVWRLCQPCSFLGEFIYYLVAVDVAMPSDLLESSSFGSFSNEEPCICYQIPIRQVLPLRLAVPLVMYGQSVYAVLAVGPYYEEPVGMPVELQCAYDTEELGRVVRLLAIAGNSFGQVLLVLQTLPVYPDARLSVLVVRAIDIDIGRVFVRFRATIHLSFKPGVRAFLISKAFELRPLIALDVLLRLCPRTEYPRFST